ncbi:MAG: tetratricopeptide repeat protein [Myxococcota bacterium]
MDCPEENVLVDFVRGELTDEDRDEIEAHIDGCELCRAVMVELVRFEPDEDELAVTDQTVAPDPVDPTRDPKESYKVAPRLAEGDKVGRYVILNKVGAGGMGVVYAAYDPELDRKVAIKLLMTSLGGSIGAELTEQRTRLLREAQSMAKLSHANVITVHDVGEFGDQVFVAMEFIDGGTLGDWAKKDRSWREVMEVFMAAGRGLAAAHRADLVHRDFKPDNVLIDKDGRVLVTNFGLARPAAGKTDTFGTLPTMESTPVMSAQLTRTGALVGTPAYMAPEQLSGKRSDALADQFSFCVALYAALYGHRPFEGRVLGELMANVTAGRVRPIPRDTAVPRQIRRALYRGLSVEPDERFPTMEALLEQLAFDPVRRWRTWATVLVPTAMLGVGVVAYTSATPNEDAFCDDVSVHLEGVWDDDRQTQLEAAFLATNRPYAASAWDGASRSLDAYAQTWLEAQKGACEASASGTLPASILALRMTCLDQQRTEFSTLLTVLEDVDDTSLQRAQDAASMLPPPSQCEDVESLARREARLDTPAKRSERQRLDEINSRASILQNTGQLDAAEREAQAALTLARESEERWAEAEALMTLAEVRELQGRFEQAESLQHEAMTAALASDHQSVMVRVALGLVWTCVDPSARIDEAERWYQHGLAALDREGGDPGMRMQLENGLISVYMSHDELAKAEAQMEIALGVREKLPVNHRSEDTTWTNLGRLYAAQGRLDDADEAFAKAVETTRARYGSQHPFMAGVLDNLGANRGRRRDYEGAHEVLEQALELRQVSLGTNHPDNATSLLNLANVDRHLGDYEGAQAKLEQAVKVAQSVAPGSSTESEMLLRLGRVQRFLGATARAEASHRAALELAQTFEGMPPGQLARYEVALGRTLQAADDHDQARASLESALTHLEGRPDDDIDVARARLWWAASFPNGVPAPKRAQVDAAAAIATSSGSPLRDAEALLAWASIAWAQSDRRSAHERADRAADLLTPLGAEGEPPLAHVETWRRDHPRP